MSLAQKLGFPQKGGYVKGQRLVTDSEGYRIFAVYLLNERNEKNPLYKDADDDSQEIKLFRGKKNQLPEQVATKVVTEICRLLRKNDPVDFKKWCRPVTTTDIDKREKDLLKNKDDLSGLNMILYPGFRFELVDTLNTTADGKNRTYLYYGERHKLDKPKKHKGNKFLFESHVVPIRRNYTLQQALLDHYFKSKTAKRRENTRGNLRSGGQGRSRTKTSVRRGRSKSPARQRVKTKLLAMTRTDLQKRCKAKGSGTWKVAELNEILEGLNLTKGGLKAQKCRRILDYHQRHTK